MQGGHTRTCCTCARRESGAAPSDADSFRKFNYVVPATSFTPWEACRVPNAAICALATRASRREQPCRGRTLLRRRQRRRVLASGTPTQRQATLPHAARSAQRTHLRQAPRTAARAIAHCPCTVSQMERFLRESGQFQTTCNSTFAQVRGGAGGRACALCAVCACVRVRSCACLCGGSMRMSAVGLGKGARVCVGACFTLCVRAWAAGRT
jgi:hypothetical protein